MIARERLLATAGICLGLVWMSACSTPSSPVDMALTASAMTPLVHGVKGDHALRVGQINGGGDTSAIGLSDVSNEALREALETSLRNLNYLADDSAKAGYVVSADLVDLDRPAVALDPVLIAVPVDLSVTARIRYTVTPVDGGAPVFSDVVATTGTASAEDAISPQGRVRKANEAAVRLNIAAFLQRLQASWK